MDKVKKIQIVENENMLQFADFKNCEVWLLNRTSKKKLGKDVVEVPELSESFLSTADKLPQLMTEISLVHEEGFDYEVLTNNSEHFARKVYTCDYDKIKTFTLK